MLPRRASPRHPPRFDVTLEPALDQGGEARRCNQGPLLWTLGRFKGVESRSLIGIFEVCGIGFLVFGSGQWNSKFLFWYALVLSGGYRLFCHKRGLIT